MERSVEFVKVERLLVCRDRYSDWQTMAMMLLGDNVSDMDDRSRLDEHVIRAAITGLAQAWPGALESGRVTRIV